MSHFRSFFQANFLPLTLLLTTFQLISYLYYKVGVFFLFTAKEKNLPIPLYWSFSGIVFFLLFLFLLPKVSFQKIFLGSLFLSPFILLCCFYTFTNFILSSGITQLVLAPLFGILGWAYVNQVVPFEKGKKMYFALYICAYILFSVFEYLLGVDKKADSFRIGALFLLTGTSYLLSIWIEKIKPLTSIEKKEEPNCRSIPLFCLAFIISGLFLIDIYYRQPTSPVNFSQQFYTIFAVKGSLATLSLALSFFIPLFIGPLLIRKIGWRFCALLVVFLAALFIPILSFFNPFYLESILYVIGLNAWITPLVHIALLSYLPRDRLFLQFWILLILQPTFQLIAQKASLSMESPLTFSIITLAIMAYSIWIVSKNHNALRQKSP